MKLNLLASVSTVAMSGVIAMGMPQSAQAGLTCVATSCSETISSNVTKTDFDNVAVVLDQFTPTDNEQLTSVVISESANFTALGSLKNNSTGTQSFKFQAGLGLTLQGGAGAPANFPLLFASGSINPKSYTLDAGASTPYNFSSVFTSNATTLTGASNVAGFIGSSTFQALFAATANTIFTGGGNNVQTNLTTTATPSVSITYNFTVPAVVPAPEPASMAALGTSLVGLGVMRRRRNKR